MEEIIGEIKAASYEQAQGIEQINKAITSMEKVIQQNAADAEETAFVFRGDECPGRDFKSVYRPVGVIGGQ